jgi:hypothetical protein
VSLRIVAATAAFLCLGTLAAIAPASAADQTAQAPAATAAPAAAPAATPAPAATAAPKDYVVSGFADLSFTHLSGYDGSIPGRVFDTANNYPNLQTLNGTLVKNGTLSGKLEVNLGSDADVMRSYGQPANTGFNITQLYLGYTSGVLAFTAGKFTTLAGEEYIRSGDNYNFSRSYLFGFAIPFTHTGLRVAYAPTSKLSLTAGVNRGWDAVQNTTAGGRAFEGSAAFNPTDKLGLTATVYTGKEPSSIATNAVAGTRTLLDLIGTYKATSKLTLVGNFDAAGQKNAFTDVTGTLAAGDASWRGFAGYANYQLNPKWSGTLRGEVFSDPDGYRTGFSQVLHEGTATLGYAPSAPLLFRLEYRADHSSVPTLKNLDSTSQNTTAVEGIVKF